MKKSFLMLGVAAMALASCTNEEVLNVADSRAISFDNTFVNNSTRAAINGVDDLTKFYVFAGFDSKVDNVYKNNVVTRGGEKPSYTWTPEYTAYWQNGETYTFDAYAANDKIENAKLQDGKLNFTDVTFTDGTNDILVAETSVPTVNIEGVQPVALEFSHVLSQVKFTFKTEIENVNFTITGVSFNKVVNKGNYAAKVWTASSDESDKKSYSFGDVTGFVTNDAEGGSTKTLIILPQQLSEGVQTVTFTLKAEGALALDERKLTAKLPTIDLTEGYSYNFVATLTSENIGKPDEDFKPIEFTISEEDGITDWTSGGDQGLK